MNAREALAADIKAALYELAGGREYPDLIDAINQLAAHSPSPANPEPACRQDSARAEGQVCDAPDRYTVVQSGFWWRVRIGNGEQMVGKCHSRPAAEELAAHLLRAFRDGHYAATRPAPPLHEGPAE